jgi:hypothetical protein
MDEILEGIAMIISIPFLIGGIYAGLFLFIGPFILFFGDLFEEIRRQRKAYPRHYRPPDPEQEEFMPQELRLKGFRGVEE